MNLKKTVFFVLAVILLVSFAAFGYFSIKSYRKASKLSHAENALAQGRPGDAKWLLRSIINDDPNNERATILLAELAKQEDHPPEEAWYRYRAVCLNPLDKTLVPPYLAALVRLRDFEKLKEYAEVSEDGSSFTFTLDDRAVQVEELVKNGLQDMADGKHADAEAKFAAGTNLNYYAVAPLLAQAMIQQNKVEAAISLYDTYLKKFPVRSLAFFQAELLAATGKLEQLAKLADLFPLSNTESLAFGCYVDTLIAFNKGDIAAAARSFPSVRAEIASPYSLLISIAVDLHNGEESQVEHDFHDLMAKHDFLDFKDRGRQLIRAHVARRFSAGEQPYKLMRLAKLVLEVGEDYELSRLILLGRYQMHTLTENELEAFITRHPDDKALLKLREWLRADLAKTGKAKAEKEARMAAALEEGRKNRDALTEAARAANRERESQRIVPKDEEGDK